MLKLLIADDNAAICDILQNFAAASGYDTIIAGDGEAALQCFEADAVDLVLLDVMMPKLDGFSVCRRIREISDVPIIMITARGEDYDRIMGLEIGADDYVVKPFSAPEVMARIKAVLRRLKREKNTVEAGHVRQSVGNLLLDETAGTVAVSDQLVNLTRKEFDILCLLLEHPGQLFSRDHLLDVLWGYDYSGDTRTVDTHIRRLRAKLEAAGFEGGSVATVWGKGYRFETGEITG